MANSSNSKTDDQNGRQDNTRGHKKVFEEILSSLCLEERRHMLSPIQEEVLQSLAEQHQLCNTRIIDITALISSILPMTTVHERYDINYDINLSASYAIVLLTETIEVIRRSMKNIVSLDTNALPPEREIEIQSLKAQADKQKSKIDTLADLIRSTEDWSETCPKYDSTAADISDCVEDLPAEENTCSEECMEYLAVAKNVKKEIENIFLESQTVLRSTCEHYIHELSKEYSLCIAKILRTQVKIFQQCKNNILQLQQGNKAVENTEKELAYLKRKLKEQSEKKREIEQEIFRLIGTDGKNQENQSESEVSSTEPDDPIGVPLDKRQVFRIIDTGNGITINIPRTDESVDDQKFVTIPWSQNERSNFLEDTESLDTTKYTLQTTIYHIQHEDQESTHLNFSGYNGVTIRCEIPMIDENVAKYRIFKGCVRFENKWQIVEAVYEDKTVTLNAEKMDALCIIYSTKESEYIVSPDGFDYVCEIDNRIRSTFPPGALTTEMKLTFKVFPVEEKNNCEFEVPGDDILVGMTPCFCVDHDENFVLEKEVSVQLPITHFCPKETEDYEVKVIGINGDSLSFTHVDDRIVEKEDNIVSFSVKSFSGTAVALIRRQAGEQSHLEIERSVMAALGFRRRCKIMLFVYHTSQRGLLLQIECVPKQKVRKIQKDRERYGYHFVSQWISKDVILRKKQRINIDVGGKFVLPTYSQSRKFFILFCPSDNENYERIPVEIKKTTTGIYGIVSVSTQNRLIFQIHYDTLRIFPPVQIMSQSTTDFFTDAGILALSKKLLRENLFQVVIFMGMSRNKYDHIVEQYTDLNRQKFIHLQEAIKQVKSDERIESLMHALNSADEDDLANRVITLYTSGIRLEYIKCN